MVLTVFKFCMRLLAKVGNACTPKKSKRISAYEQFLNESVDLYDLEAREREWSRRMQHRHLY